MKKSSIPLSILRSKIILTCLLLFFTAIRLNAQTLTNYAFTTSTGTFTALSSPISSTGWTGGSDDGVSGLIPIGFDFWYMGVRYTNIATTTNGWLSLGSIPPNFIITNNLSTGGAPRPIIAPLWDDLDIVATTNVTYKTTGTAGSRVFTIQYLNVKWSYLAGGSVISFQVRFYEGTGKIEFVYRPEATAASGASASIGITATATGSGNFLSVNNAGTSVSSTVEANVTTKPVSGKTYAFTPPVPIAPGSLTFTSVGISTITLNWTDLSSNERGFVIMRSTDGVNYSFIAQTAAGVITSSQAGLSGNTTYYWKVYSITEGAFSTALSGSQATLCNGPVISLIPLTGLIANYKLAGGANDATDNDNGTFQGGTPTQTTDRFSNSNSAYTFNGTSNYISTANTYVNPVLLTVSIWFKTSTVTGGKLIGLGKEQTGVSSQYDRHIYMNNAGQIYFGVNGTAVTTINSPLSYNDNNWHLATATLSGAGMVLYMDGIQVAANPAETTGEIYTGYWRIGYDIIIGWPSQPSNTYFTGALDDVLIYNRALSAAEITTIYNSPDGAGSNSPVCAGASLNLTATTIASATYSWTGPNSFTSTLQNPTITYSTAYAGTYTVQVTTAGCITPATASVIVTSISAAGAWTGNVSTDWATTGNWCSGVLPTSTTDVTILSTATRMPAITSSVSCRNLNLNTACTLTVTGTLNIAGTITNTGTFTVSSGTIVMNGTSAQIVPASAFNGNLIKNLTINNTAGVTLGGTLNLTGILLASNGQFNSGGYLTLISTATQTALIDGSGAGNILNNVTMQRYLTAGFGYKYFSSPFQAATVSNFSSTVDLNAAFPSFYSYIENKSTTGFTTYTTTSNVLNPLQGYAADFGSSTAQKTVSISGVVSNGSISSTLYNNNQTYTQGFNLVGNPYASPVNWNSAGGWTKTNIDNAIYYFDSSITNQYTGTYSTYINGVSSDGIATNIIASMQGFFVHVSNGTYPVTGTLAINNNARVNDLSPVFHKVSMIGLSASTTPPILLRLSAGFSDHTLSSDPMVVYFKDSATPSFDKEFDAIKLMNIDELLPNLYSLGAGATKLVINALPGVDTLTVIPLGLQTDKDGTIVFNLRNLEQWPSNLHLYLTDAEKGTDHDLQKNPIYTVNLKKGNYEKRFSLRSVPLNLLEQTNDKNDIYNIYGSGGALFLKIKLIDDQKGFLMISDLLGQLISTRSISGNGDYELKGMTTNIVYIISFKTGKVTHTKKILMTEK